MLEKKLYTILPLLTGLALFLEGVDATGISVAIPTIAREFNIPAIQLKLAVMSYLITMAMFIPVSGWFADRFGSRKVFASAMCLFGLGSLGCAISHNLEVLIAFRLLQGLGSAMMLPVGRLILYQTFEKHELVTVIPKVPLIGLMGMTFGPIIAGFLTNYLSWRWIFYINIPVVVLGITCILKFVPVRDHYDGRKLDFIGMVLLAASIASVLALVETLGEAWVPSSYRIVWFTGSVAVIASYILHSRNSAHPILDTSLFKISSYRILSIYSLLMRCLFGGFSVLYMLQLQLILGYEPMEAALLFLPYCFGLLFMTLNIKHIVTYCNLKWVLFINGLVMAILFSSFAIIRPDINMVIISILLFIFGINMVIQFSISNLVAYADISPDKTSRAVSINSTIQQAGLGLGVGFAMLLLQTLQGGDVIRNNANSIHAFSYTYIILGCGLFILAFLLLRLAHDVDRPVRFRS